MWFWIVMAVLMAHNRGLELGLSACSGRQPPQWGVLLPVFDLAVAYSFDRMSRSESA